MMFCKDCLYWDYTTTNKKGTGVCRNAPWTRLGIHLSTLPYDNCEKFGRRSIEVNLHIEQQEAMDEYQRKSMDEVRKRLVEVWRIAHCEADMDTKQFMEFCRNVVDGRM